MPESAPVAMRAILTGLSGTVAPAVASALRARGAEVIAWNRAEVPIDDPAAMRALFERAGPDGFFHIATGPPAWAEAVAGLCHERGVRFLFTSSVSVFSGHGTGPHRVSDPPAAADDYGRYKIECERRVRAANPEAIIARLGWQIGDAPGSNTMTDFLERTQRERGRVEASTAWWPSCSFLDDTAEALAGLMAGPTAGLWHVNGNADLTFFEIATALSARHGGRWTVVPGETPARDDRMIDERVRVRPVRLRLG